MANIKSAKKRILVNETKAAKNKAIKSRVKTSVKKVEAAVAQKDFPSYKSCKRNCLIFDINMNHKKTSATVMANVFFVYAPAF